jgi:hypothetical protein
VLAAICAVLGYGWIAGRQTALPELALVRLTSDHGLTTGPALSPNGATVAYASDRASTGSAEGMPHS